MDAGGISYGSLFLRWRCGACLRLTVLADPPVISVIQQDLHLSGTEVGLYPAYRSSWSQLPRRQGWY